MKLRTLLTEQEMNIIDHMASMYGLKAKKVDVSFKKVSSSNMKECFDNAYKYVTRNTDATYVLGYMSFHGMPIEHAWIKEKGKYHEITIQSDDAPMMLNIIHWLNLIFQNCWNLLKNLLELQICMNIENMEENHE
jgi:hypothetical protein